MELARRIADLAYDLPEALLEGLAEGLAGCGDAAMARTRGLSSRLSSQSSRSRFDALLNEWKATEKIDGEALALALHAASLAHERWRATQSLELVWTGPGPAHSTLRRTDQALLEVIERSQHELWVVSFAAYRIDAVTAALQSAVDRGVRVSIILESSQHSEGRMFADGIQAMGERLLAQARLFVWPTDKRPASNDGKRGMLHAKCAVADENHLFVSSANLTEAALHLNMELGLLVSGGRQPAQVQQHLRWLVEYGVLAVHETEGG